MENNTKELFEEHEEELSTDNIKVIDEVVADHKPKKVKKVKEKKVLDEVTKKRLLDNLAKGRATAKKNRELKLKAKAMLKDKHVVDEKVAKEMNKLNNKPNHKMKIIEDKPNNNDFLSLKKELAEIKQMLRDKTITEEKKKELQHEKKEISIEIKEQKKEVIHEKKPEIKPTVVVTPKAPIIQGFSTLRNRQKRKQRLGF